MLKKLVVFMLVALDVSLAEKRKIGELAGATEQTFIVAGVLDEKKDERLIVLHKLGDTGLKAVWDFLRAVGDGR